MATAVVIDIFAGNRGEWHMILLGFTPTLELTDEPLSNIHWEKSVSLDQYIWSELRERLPDCIF
jgi:hypothetical protein